jgi:hypothetical protein
MYQNKVPIGFLFFTSFQTDAYTDEHVRLLKHLAMQLALLLMIAKTESRSCSQRSVGKKKAVSEKPTSDTGNHQSAPSVSQDESNRWFLSQLKPGAVLLEEIRLPSGGLLVSAGTELTQTSIDRLIAMKSKGLLKVGQLRVRDSR